MKCECVKCRGNGEIECEHCGQSKDCVTCGGEGYVIECLSTVTLPKHLKNLPAIERLQDDARRCVADHEKLVRLNPAVKASYDRQLEETLRLLETQAEELADS